MTTIFDDRLLAPGVASNEHLAAPAEADHQLRNDGHQIVRALERAFAQPFAVIDCATGHLVRPASDGLPFDHYRLLATCSEVAQRGRPEIIDEVSPLLLLGVPLPSNPTEPVLMALAAFVTEPIDCEAQIFAAAREFGIEPAQTLRWAQLQTPWPAHAVQEVSSAVAEKTTLQQAQIQLKRQLADLSSHLLTTFEEITLLHRLTEHLSISKSVTDLCGLSVQWLSEVVPAKCVAIWFDGMSELDEQDAMERGVELHPVLISHGECPLDETEFARFIERLGPRVGSEPLVLNRAATSSPTWFYPDVRELISVPIREGNRIFGWLLVLNHTGAVEVTNSEVEFGTVEACLMASVATILGIHCGNIALYREQADFFASVVRALTSAIDAKDPYTCGHSDRVARLAVSLAREVGCSKEELNTIYLSGLLHDIGKIGIDDNVLRKPGPLTPEELDHIKIHPELGCRILDGVKQLDQVLPVVRHHHEAWNGAG